MLSKTVPFLPAIAHKCKTSRPTATKLKIPRPIFPRKGSVKFENRFGSNDAFKMAADQRKYGMPIFSKCRNFVNNSWNCTKFEAQGDLVCPSDFSYVDLSVTSRDLSMTLTVFFKFGRKWTLAPKLLGLEWYNLGKSQLKVFTMGLFHF